jgi:hypothetical protein
MKLVLVSLLLSATAMAAETTAPAITEVTATTPKQVCEALAKAASENNFKAFSDWTAMPGMMMGANGKSCPMMGEEKECTDKNCPMHKEGKGKAKGMAKGKAPMHPMGGMGQMHGMNMEEGFKKMHEKEMERLKDLNCKEEKIAGDHAWVEAISQNETRLVPFKMVDGKWKFDMKTYHSFYHPAMPPPAKK